MFRKSEITDRQVEKAVAGCRESLDAVLAAMSVRVLPMIVVRLSPHRDLFHACEELSQNTLISLSRGITRLERPTASGLRRYVSGIVSNQVAEFLRNGARTESRRVRSLDSTVMDDSGIVPLWQTLSGSSSSPSSVAERDELRDRLIDEIGKLDVQYRDVIIYVFIDQLETREIAELLNTTRPAVSMTLLRGLRTLRRRLDKRMNADDVEAE